MRLYLDEDMVNALLVRLLERAGHDVQTANSAGMLGRSDPAQFTLQFKEVVCACPPTTMTSKSFTC